MEQKLLTYSGITLEYFVTGTGNDVILCLPGFGRTADEMLSLIGSRQKKIIAVNHVFHGNSTCDKPLSKSEFSSIINLIIQQENETIRSLEMLGYSMGGRLALCFLELNPEKVNRLTLLAPDGVMINRWYKFTNSAFGKWLFRSLVIKNARVFFKMVRFLGKLKLLNSYTLKFLNFHLDTDDKRQLVYRVWSHTARLIPDHASIQKNYQGQSTLYLGKFDKTIPLKVGKLFQQKISSKVKIVEVETGHNLMKKEILNSVV